MAKSANKILKFEIVQKVFQINLLLFMNIFYNLNIFQINIL